MSTLHTNTAAGAITRLEDMGIEPFLLSSSLLGVLSQRLVRTLCDHCKVGHHASEQECLILGAKPKKADDIMLYSPKGCAACNQTGYRGRTGIHELIIVDEGIREIIHNGHGEQAIEKYVRKNTPSIREDGCKKVLLGTTSLEEVLRVTRED
jgi:general secretion pathway protein E